MNNCRYLNSSRINEPCILKADEAQTGQLCPEMHPAALATLMRALTGALDMAQACSGGSP